ncbi:heme lyase NrfEFG subunit NrfF [Bibersteinia trehalosi]|uniref:heme lyase NrfEFG subunit NrfF n=1 Tax=Bibersteinia trehalosi TaxID=47735 RepID=UPI002D76AA06|nr:heme lyase NrfEFG subunit NrfF [Bibersteinia trehalosi]
MKKWLALFAFVGGIAQAEMVDTFEFSHAENRVRAVALAKSLRCPQCQNQNLVESNATQAFQLRLEVYEMVEQGKSNQEIIQIMTNRFGHFVNYKPPVNTQTWVLWGVPFGLLSALLLAIAWRVRKKK